MVKTSERYCWKLMGRRGTPPNKSCCMSSVVHGDKMYVFGGGIIKKIYSDLYEYDINTGIWSKMECTNVQEIEPTLSHSAVVYNDEMVVFGGMTEGRCHNYTYTLDFATLAWNKLKHSGEPPQPRKGHTSVVYKGKMYVLMGAHYMGGVFSDMFSLDLATSRWECITCEAGNPATSPKFGRTGHSTCLYKSEMIIFGGMGSSGGSANEWLNDVYSYNIETKQWRELACNTRLCLAVPEGRYSHSSWVQGDCLFVFGGDSNSCTTYYNDLWMFDMRTCQWRLVSTGGDLPSKRSGHTAVLHGGVALCFGGEKPNASDDAPSSTTSSPDSEVEYSNNLFGIPLLLDPSTSLKQLLVNKIVRHELYKHPKLFRAVPAPVVSAVGKWVPTNAINPPPARASVDDCCVSDGEQAPCREGFMRVSTPIPANRPGETSPSNSTAAATS